MTSDELRILLDAVGAGALTPADALAAFGAPGYVETGDAKVDVDRGRRRGFPEVIYCASKNARQIAAIAGALVEREGRAFGTRCAPEIAGEALALQPGGVYDPVSRTIRFGEPYPRFTGMTTAIVAAGTSDLPVAEEARQTLEMFGAAADVIHDVGVAGLHRLLDQRERIEQASVVIVVAGMEGALPSVVGGLFAQPVIAVPTSVGYGAALGGFTALFSMLTSCAGGISVVNIDNGFGAALAALAILRTAARRDA